MGRSMMGERGWRPLAASILAVAAVLGFSAESRAQQQAVFACPAIVPQRADWIVRVPCDAQGRPLHVERKWPMGSPQAIGTIRVPWGFRDLVFGPSVGAQLMDNGHAPSVQQGYGGFFFWALLPGVTPHDERNPPVVDRAMEFDLLTVRVGTPITTAFPVWDRQLWLQRTASTLLRDLNSGPVYRDVPKVPLEGRFGLNRIGPAWVVRQPMEAIAPPPHNDLWFDGADPATSSTFIVCGSDYRRDGTRDPEDFPRSLCEHWFAHDGMTASVKLTYWKKHLANWRDIERRVAKRLDQFKQAGTGGK